MRRWCHLYLCTRSAVREPALLYRQLNWHIAAAVKSASEWMTSHEEQVKDQHRQAE